MKTQPAVGTPGGQTYDVARAIGTFLSQMAEGGANRLPAAVMKELLQNADDAGASEVTVTLDERTPPPHLRGIGYDPLLAPALLVRNDAKFRLKDEVAGKDVDDFTALCDVASGHKRLQAAAAGRFGIGFNSVYFLTDIPIVFSRRLVHVFDLRHHVFEGNGWVFTIDDFFDKSPMGPGPLKSLIEWALPKAASGASKSFDELAADRSSDYAQTLFRLPLRGQEGSGPALWGDRFRTVHERRGLLRQMAEQAARAAPLLKRVQSVRFALLGDDAPNPRVLEEVVVTAPSAALLDFVAKVEEQSRSLEVGARHECRLERRVRWRTVDDAEPARDTCWDFAVRHIARFDSVKLAELRERLYRNDEKAVPWAALAVPLTLESFSFDGDETPSWRVFLPLAERGPCACVLHAALFVGPSRQRVEFRTDGSDEALRKTEWNKTLVSEALVPLVQDFSVDAGTLLPGEILEQRPGTYLSLFPKKPERPASCLADAFAESFAAEPWTLWLRDLWGRPFQLMVGDLDPGLALQMVPEWLARYGDRFEALALPPSYFVRWTVGEALEKRLEKGPVRRDVPPGVHRAVLENPAPPDAKDLERLLGPVVSGATGLDPVGVEGLWAFSRARDQALIRYEADRLFLLDGPGPARELWGHLQTIALAVEGTEWVSPDQGLPRVLDKRAGSALPNVMPPDLGAACELLRRLRGGDAHDCASSPHALRPVFEFLETVPRGRLPSDLRLGFLVRTAPNKADRRRLGVILLRPAQLSPDDEAIWEGIFRRVFAEVDPSVAPAIHGLLRAHPEAMSQLSAPDCRLAMATAADALEILHLAGTAAPDVLAQIGEVLVKSGDGGSARDPATRAAQLLLEAIADKWELLDEPHRTTVLALPLHRTAARNHVALMSPSGEDRSSIPQRFQIQSEDDLTDAPVATAECELLQCASTAIKRFYRQQLRITSRDRVSVLADVLEKIGHANVDSTQLLDYVARHYRETVEQKARSSDPADREEAARLERLFGAARLVPCSDGTWRAAIECSDGADVADDLVRHEWAKGRALELVSELFDGRPVLSFQRNLRENVLRVVSIPRLDVREIAARSVSSPLANLRLAERVRILDEFWGDHRQVSRATVLDDAPLPTLSGPANLDRSELVSGAAEELLGAALGPFAPNAVDVGAFAREVHLPEARARTLLACFGVPERDAKELEGRVRQGFAAAWPGLGPRQRQALLVFVGRRGLASDLSEAASALDVVRIGSKGGPWALPADVVSPAWRSRMPKPLPDHQLPATDADAEAVASVWDEWCGLRDFGSVLAAVMRVVQKGSRGQWTVAAGDIGRWIDTLRRGRVLHDEELFSALREVSWVLASRDGEVVFSRPADVIDHPAAPVLEHHFWVAEVSLPASLDHAAREAVGFRSAPEASVDSVDLLVRCLAASGDAPIEASLAAYRLLVAMTSEDEQLAEAWQSASTRTPVFRLFRKPERVVRAPELYLGDGTDGQEFEDHGEVLFCLRAATGIPSPVAASYERLGVPRAASGTQALEALCRLEGSGVEARKVRARLVELAERKAGDIDSSSVTDEIRVLACSGSLEPLSRCYFDDALGRKGAVEREGSGRVIDAEDPANRRLMDLLGNLGVGVVQQLQAVGVRELAEEPQPAEIGPLAQQALEPWDTWLGELCRNSAEIRSKVEEKGFEPPDDKPELVPVQGFRIRYVLQDGEVVTSRDSRTGPLALERNGKILVRRSAVERDYLADPACLDPLDEAIAGELAVLLATERSPDGPARMREIALETLERPSKYIERYRTIQREHLVHQYRDQVADPAYAPLFEEYLKTRKDSRRARELLAEMDARWQEKFVEERRAQIRGHGYDEFSVFAELVQNADDAYLQAEQLGLPEPQRRSVLFRYVESAERTRLLVEHFGRPFNLWRCGSTAEPNFRRDVEGVLRSAGSFKVHVALASGSERAVGRFGLGFKSVYLLTETPAIHSGAWHFRIEAGCLPQEIERWPEQSAGSTLFDLPLRTGTHEEADPDGHRLVNLLPFLRRVRALELQGTHGDPLRLSIEVEALQGTAPGSAFAELVTIAGVKHVDGLVVRMLRLRDAEHAGQVGVLLSSTDWRPIQWDEAFERDLFAVLPLQGRLGCGIGVSHLFEVQSGRTHLVDPEKNKLRSEELAGLLRGLPDVVAWVRAGGGSAGEFLEAFWSLWKWDRGDSETADVRRAFAWQLVELAANAAVLPTLVPNSPASLSDGPCVFFTSGIPQGTRDALVESGIHVPKGSGAGLTRGRIVSSATGSTLDRACRFARREFPAALRRLGWEDVGEAIVASEALPPGLADALAEAASGSEEATKAILAWLSDCKMHGFDEAEQQICDWPVRFLDPRCPDVGLLPRRLIRVAADQYSVDALELLLQADLKARPPASHIQSWIEERGLTVPECIGVLTFLIRDHRFQDSDYRGLRTVVRSAWFGPERLTLGKAAEQGLLPDELLSSSEFKAWLGLLEEREEAEPTAAPALVVDPREVLEGLYEWWSENGADWTARYEREWYPGGKRLVTQDRFIRQDREHRQRWLQLLILGACHTIGGTKPGVHRTFLERCRDEGWLDVFSDVEVDAVRWFGVLESYLDSQSSDHEYYHSMAMLFVRIFQLSRWLDDYVESFRQISRVRGPFSLDSITRSRASQQFEGGGPDAPPLTRTLGPLGRHFVVRELTRASVLNNPHADRHSYVAGRRVRGVLAALECPLPDGRDGEHSAAIHSFLCKHLGHDRATFGRSYDLPLRALASDERLQKALRLDVTPWEAAGPGGRARSGFGRPDEGWRTLGDGRRTKIW